MQSSGVEKCSLFFLLYHASAKFSDICGMKLGHVGASGHTLVVGFRKLKNDKSNSSFSHSLVAERIHDPLSCLKLINKLKERRMSDSASKNSYMFPLMKNTRVFNSNVSYRALRTVFLENAVFTQIL